ncbi:MAG: AAA family ATPase [Deltaproteobacteria bacterium]|jgi:predicted ATPase|nr:AAA family ATPase [Deltaproteobacteria bacterium]MDL1987661.1 AAA family ATPase [Deltaproteobacteria bacterium]
MLRKIKIRGYKSLVDAEVCLKPLSVLFGPNAAGKSNFLDALQLLSGMATSRTLKEAFEPPYRGKPLESFAFGEEGIKGLLGREVVSFSMEADVELSNTVVDLVNRQIREMKRTKASPEKAKSPTKSQSFVRERHLRYRIEIEILPKLGILRVADEYLASLNKKGDISRKRSPFLEKVKNRLHLRMEGQAHPTYYERYLDHSILSMPLYPPHYPHLVAIRQELASWFFFYFEPRERMRAPNAVKEIRHIGLMGEELASFLNTLRALDEPQFKAVEKALRMIIPEVTGIDVSVNELGEVELKILEGKTPIPARVLSEGTLRILGLLSLVSAKDPPALLGFEEPENGIHPRRIRMIADLLKNRAATGDTQVIVTTHSPILPDMVSDENLFVCHKKQGHTAIDPFSTWGPLGRSSDIKKALDAEETTVSERILRGDFDA